MMISRPAIATGFAVALGVATAAAQQRAANATDVPRAELMTVLKSIDPGVVSDQQVRVADAGGYNVAVGVLHRSAKAKQTAIAHSQVTEIYYVLDGAGTFVTGGTMTAAAPSDPQGNAVKVLVGPSTTGATIVGGKSRRIAPGDVIVVPAGVAHWFSAIEKDLDYLVFRVDPDRVLPADYVHPLVSGRK